MVNVKNHKTQIIEMARFYIELPNKVESDADKYNAEIGRAASEKLLKLLAEVGDELQKHQSNQLDALLMSLTRGVEQFEDKEAQHLHRQYGQLRSNLRVSLFQP